MWPSGIKFTFTEYIYAERTVLMFFILGVGISVFLAFKLGFFLFLFPLSLALIVIGFKKTNYKKWIIGLSFIGILFGSLIGTRAFNELKQSNTLLRNIPNQISVIKGKIVGVEDSQEGQFITILLKEINTKPWTFSKTKICFYTQSSKSSLLGNILAVKGNLLVQDRINLNCSGYISNPTVLSQEIINPKSFNNFLLQLRKNIKISLTHYIREPFLSLAQGYVLGDDKTTDPELKDTLEQTSMTHIVAVSGFNIAILFLACRKLFLALHFSPKSSYILAVFLNILFIILAGSPASAIRAGIMLSLILGAERLERMGNFLNILLLTAFIMILINPLILIYDLGFQLSFLASLGLLYKQIVKPKKIQQTINFTNTIKTNLKETFWDSFFVILFVSPLLIWNGGELSFKPLLANLPILPLVPFITFLVIFLLFVSPILASGASLLGLAVEKLIGIQLVILRLVSSFNFLSFKIPQLTFIWFSLYYIVLLYWLHSKLKETKAVI